VLERRMTAKSKEDRATQVMSQVINKEGE